jgi:signal transduction histidine kinase
VSHELRTPITSILGYTELLMSDETGTLPTMHRQILSRVERNGRRLMGLVEDVLTMSQIEVGNLRFRFGEHDLGVVVARAVETEVSVFGVAGVLLQQDLTDEPLPVTADPDKLERAFAALLDNAAKYSDAGSSVLVSLRAEADDAVLVIEDHGIGIKEEDQARMFDRFWRSSEANDRAIQGAGLGLAVAHAIVEGHHGTITWESAPGQGTTFTVTLPLRAE